MINHCLLYFSYYAKLKRMEEEKQKELELKYRDRVRITLYIFHVVLEV